MLWEIGTLAKHVLLPPILWGWLLAIGLWLWYKRPAMARSAVAIGIVLLYLSATSLVAGFLIRTVEDNRPTSGAGTPKAVVILGGGRSYELDAFGKVVRGRPGPATAERLIEGVRIAREMGLPVLVSSGKPDGVDPAEAVVMQEVMVRQFGVSPKWVESESRNTLENALFSAPILKREGIQSVVLVTHGYHMRRSRYLFEKMGIAILPAPVDRLPPVSSMTLGRFLQSLIPTAAGMGMTYLACNEIAGLLYARLRMAFSASATPSAGVAN